MTHTVYTSAHPERANAKKQTARTLIALLLLVLALTLSGCGLFKDRSLTTLTIEDALFDKALDSSRAVMSTIGITRS